MDKIDLQDSRDMLRVVREVDPLADPVAVRQYALEIADADTVLLCLDLDPVNQPLSTSFSAEWPSEFLQ